MYVEAGHFDVGLPNSLCGHLGERATSRWALVYGCGSLGYSAGWGEVVIRGDRSRIRYGEVGGCVACVEGRVGSTRR